MVAEAKVKSAGSSAREQVLQFLLACGKGDIRAVKAKVEQDSSFLYALHPDSRQSGLTLACLRGHEELYECLSKGLHELSAVQHVLDVVDSSGSTPLLNATHSCNVRIVRSLLDLGADISLRATNRRNIAHIACTKKDGIQLLQLFARRNVLGKLLEEEDLWGVTPLQLAHNKRHLDQIDFLERHIYMALQGGPGVADFYAHGGSSSSEDEPLPRRPQFLLPRLMSDHQAENRFPNLTQTILQQHLQQGPFSQRTRGGAVRKSHPQQQFLSRSHMSSSPEALSQGSQEFHLQHEEPQARSPGAQSSGTRQDAGGASQHIAVVDQNETAPLGSPEAPPPDASPPVGPPRAPRQEKLHYVQIFAREETDGKNMKSSASSNFLKRPGSGSRSPSGGSRMRSPSPTLRLAASPAPGETTDLVEQSEHQPVMKSRYLLLNAPNDVQSAKKGKVWTGRTARPSGSRSYQRRARQTPEPAKGTLFSTKKTPPLTAHALEPSGSRPGTAGRIRGEHQADVPAAEPAGAGGTLNGQQSSSDGAIVQDDAVASPNKRVAVPELPRDGVQGQGMLNPSPQARGTTGKAPPHAGSSSSSSKAPARSAVAPETLAKQVPPALVMPMHEFELIKPAAGNKSKPRKLPRTASGLRADRLQMQMQYQKSRPHTGTSSASGRFIRFMDSNFTENVVNLSPTCSPPAPPPRDLIRNFPEDVAAFLKTPQAGEIPVYSPSPPRSARGSKLSVDYSRSMALLRGPGGVSGGSKQVPEASRSDGGTTSSPSPAGSPVVRSRPVNWHMNSYIMEQEERASLQRRQKERRAASPTGHQHGGTSPNNSPKADGRMENASLSPPSSPLGISRRDNLFSNAAIQISNTAKLVTSKFPGDLSERPQNRMKPGRTISAHSRERHRSTGADNFSLAPLPSPRRNADGMPDSPKDNVIVRSPRGPHSPEAGFAAGTVGLVRTQQELAELPVVSEVLGRVHEIRDHGPSLAASMERLRALESSEQAPPHLDAKLLAALRRRALTVAPLTPDYVGLRQDEPARRPVLSRGEHDPGVQGATGSTSSPSSRPRSAVSATGKSAGGGAKQTSTSASATSLLVPPVPDAAVKGAGFLMAKAPARNTLSLPEGLEAPFMAAGRNNPTNRDSGLPHHRNTHASGRSKANKAGVPPHLNRLGMGRPRTTPGHVTGAPLHLQPVTAPEKALKSLMATRRLVADKQVGLSFEDVYVTRHPFVIEREGPPGERGGHERNNLARTTANRLDVSLPGLLGGSLTSVETPEEVSLADY
ncbi:unnamed protein product [Amoebophrya sp. A120]|nr:unnamed protein product [Amoebophrya sp. A120]|eukprot:GSA120T00017928001.1